MGIIQKSSSNIFSCSRRLNLITLLKMKKLILVLILVFISGCTHQINSINGGNKMTDVILIISQEGYQPIEFSNTKAEIEKAGLTTQVASITKDIATAADGSTYNPDLSIEEINPDNYKAIAIIGGPGSPKLLESNSLLEKIKEFNSKNKIVAAICFSPVILAKAGILKGKKATVFPNQDLINKLKEAGAIYTAETVTKDNNIITGNGPDAATEFGKTIADSLK